MVKHDRHHKDLGAKRILVAMGDSLARFLSGRPTARMLEAHTREYAIKQRTPDLELHMTDPALGEFLAIIEIQTRVDPALPGRLAALATWLVHERGLPVIPVIVYLGPPGERRPPPFSYELAGARAEVRHVEIVLSELDAREMLSGGLTNPWWPFMPFMRHGRDPDVVDRLVEAIAARPELADVADDMLRMASYVVELNQLRTLLEGTVFDKIWDMEPWEGSLMWELRERWREQAIADGLAKGLEEGRLEGRQEGRQEGHAEGQSMGRRQEALRVARRQIARKFGIPDPELSEALEALSVDQLEDLLDAILDMTNRADLDSWFLGRAAAPQD